MIGQTKEFKEETIGLITEQGYTVPKAADALGVSANLLYTWKQKAEELETSSVSPDEKAELFTLRKEVKPLWMEKEMLKIPKGHAEASAFFAREMK